MSRLAVYEARNVFINFALLSLDDGRGENFCKITSNPAYKIEGPGADGLVIRCGTADNIVKVELTFKGSSNAHAKLSAITIADQSALNGAGVAPLLIKDSNGSTLISTDQAWIAGFPEKGFGVTPADVTWSLECVITPGQRIIGGN